MGAASQDGHLDTVEIAAHSSLGLLLLLFKLRNCYILGTVFWTSNWLFNLGTDFGGPSDERHHLIEVYPENLVSKDHVVVTSANWIDSGICHDITVVVVAVHISSSLVSISSVVLNRTPIASVRCANWSLAVGVEWAHVGLLRASLETVQPRHLNALCAPGVLVCVGCMERSEM